MENEFLEKYREFIGFLNKHTPEKIKEIFLKKFRCIPLTVKDLKVLIPEYLYNDFKSYKICDEITKLDLYYEYAKGFIEGFNNDFPTFFNTIESRKDEILKHSIFVSELGFPLRSDLANGKMLNHFDSIDFYNKGLEIGKSFKAWSIIFESPTIFKNEFEKGAIPNCGNYATLL